SNAQFEAAEAALDELAMLADTAGAEAVERVIQVRETPDTATYLGKGKAREVVELAQALHADAIIFDDELAPAQGRNLEDLAGINPLAPNQIKIIDRTGLILDVFSQHAQSAEGKLQVELAQLNYHIPRLRGWSDVMSRLGGGIGTRGPGETKLEVDRRRIRKRLTKLRGDLADVERTRDLKRKSRALSRVPQISLVGYTNSGKSTMPPSPTPRPRWMRWQGSWGRSAHRRSRRSWPSTSGTSSRRPMRRCSRRGTRGRCSSRRSGATGSRTSWPYWGSGWRLPGSSWISRSPSTGATSAATSTRRGTSWRRPSSPAGTGSR